MPIPEAVVKRRLGFEYKVLFTVTLSMLIISSISVGLRIYVRARILPKMGKEDWAMLAAQMSYFVVAGLTFALVHTERHFGENPPSAVVARLDKQLRLANAAYCLTMLLAKISLGFFFLAIFGQTLHWRRILINFLVCLGTLVGLIYMALDLFTCGIDVTTPSVTGQCSIQGPFVGISTAWSILNATSDFAFGAIAVAALWGSTMPRPAKIVCGALLIFATLGGIASVLRVVVQLVPFDEQLQALALARWSILEAGLCITVGSLVTLRPLFRRLWPKPKPNAEMWTERRKSQDTFSVYTQQTLPKIHSGFEPGLVIVGNCDPSRKMEEGREKDIVVTKVFELDVTESRKSSTAFPEKVKYSI